MGVPLDANANSVVCAVSAHRLADETSDVRMQPAFLGPGFCNAKFRRAQRGNGLFLFCFPEPASFREANYHQARPLAWKIHKGLKETATRASERL
jgi:hypothetical protein